MIIASLNALSIFLLFFFIIGYLQACFGCWACWIVWWIPRRPQCHFYFSTMDRSRGLETNGLDRDKITGPVYSSINIKCKLHLNFLNKIMFYLKLIVAYPCYFAGIWDKMFTPSIIKCTFN